MTIEEKLKEYILTKYKSIREFVLDVGIPYSTFDTILKRGIMNASIGNIVKICVALEISADALANGKIVPYEKKTEIVDLRQMLFNYRINSNIIFELDGATLSEDEAFYFIESFETVLEMIKRRRERQKLLEFYKDGLKTARKIKEGEEE